ncbi:MAG: succinate dehydrogenase assembly factor 2 [Gammaproteobacteria bacterium]|jgi:antitoxin CptB
MKIKPGRCTRWQCKRGMLELDEILLDFFTVHYKNLTGIKQQAFDLLLQENDADLFSWLFGNTLPEDVILQDIVLLVKSSYGLLFA